MNETTFYKHFPFVKSEKSPLIYVKEFSRSDSMSFWSNLINSLAGIIEALFIPVVIEQLLYTIACLRASWSLLTGKPCSLTWWWDLGRRGCNSPVTTCPNCDQAGDGEASEGTGEGQCLQRAAESSAVFHNQKLNLATSWGPGPSLHRIHKSEKTGNLCLWGWGRVKTCIFKIFCFYWIFPDLYLSETYYYHHLLTKCKCTLFSLQTFWDKHNQTARRLYSPKHPLHAKSGSLPVPFVKVSFSFVTFLSNL